MAVKILFSVSLLFWLLLFCCDCGLQGVKASPSSKTFANRLDLLRSLYPKRTSIINETLSQDQKVDPKLIQLVELTYAETDFPDRPGAIIDLSAIYSGGWLVASLYADIDWIGTVGSIVVSGGPAQDNWALTLGIPDGLIALDYVIYVTLLRVVNETTAATVKAQGVPVEQIYRFDDTELNVKAPPEIRQEINYSKQQKNK